MRPYGQIEPVTKERLARRDHYRLQVNADQELVAFLYNSAAAYFPKAVMDKVRNKVAEVVEAELRHQFELLVKSNQGFAASLPRYLERYIYDPELRQRARSLFQENGWREDGNSLL